jgi:MYND finger
MTDGWTTILFALSGCSFRQSSYGVRCDALNNNGSSSQMSFEGAPRDAGKSDRSCAYPNCGTTSNLRCSRCKAVYYCSAEHQRKDWNIHKSYCMSVLSASGSSVSEFSSLKACSGQASSSRACSENDGGSGENRRSRCMFCGEELILGSEDEAVKHLEVCDALQEQLNSNEQFTVPSRLRSKIPDFKPR